MVIRRLGAQNSQPGGIFKRKSQANNMGMDIGGLLGLIWLFIVIWAIVKVAQSSAGAISKLLWILILLFLPVLGLIAWLLLGPKS